MENIMLKNRNIDVVFVIDGTGSMAPCIESVKKNAKRFHTEFVSAMTKLNSEINSMRVKVIVFRDYKDDGDQAMIESPFFELPDDNDELDSFLADIYATGGGDNDENGLEALYYAMKSNFTNNSEDRQVIALFTDADALELRKRADEPNYPQDMVDMNGFINTWNCAVQDSSLKLRNHNKRMVLFAPEETKYKTLSTILDKCYYKPISMSKGLGDINFSDIITLIAASVSKN